MGQKKQLSLKNIKQKFASARELCPGMSDDIYALTDYISLVANDELVPSGLAVCMTLVMDDLQKGRNGLNPNKPLPEHLIQHKEQVLAQMSYLPQVVDAIASEDFATEFRRVCEQVFGFNPPKRVIANTTSSYPEYVVAAIDWWANRVQSPKFDAGKGMSFLAMMVPRVRKDYSEEELKTFKDSLAKSILAEIESFGNCSLSVDYHPCAILANAGKTIALTDVDFPWKTSMYITNQAVEVSEGLSGENKTIWSKEVNITPDEPKMHK